MGPGRRVDREETNYLAKKLPNQLEKELKKSKTK